MRIVAWLKSSAAELSKFASVGALGVVVDAGVFNLLRWGPMSPDSTWWGDTDRVVTAKISATLVAMTFAYLAHRYWTFAARRTDQPRHEVLLFGLINALALAVQAGVLALSHHGFGFTSLWADNIASYAIGLPLGTLIRYVGYRRFVFDQPSEAVAPDRPEFPRSDGGADA